MFDLKSIQKEHRKVGTYPKEFVANVRGFLDGIHKSQAWNMPEPWYHVHHTITCIEFPIEFIHATQHLLNNRLVMAQSSSQNHLTHNVQRIHFKHLVRTERHCFHVRLFHLCSQSFLNFRNFKSHQFLHRACPIEIKLVEDFERQSLGFFPMLSVAEQKTDGLVECGAVQIMIFPAPVQPFGRAHYLFG